MPKPTVSGMFSVVAPLSTAIWQTSHMKSGSERNPSSGENSTSSSVATSPGPRAPPASAFTWSRVIRSFFVMWISDVAMKTWMRLRSA